MRKKTYIGLLAWAVAVPGVVAVFLIMIFYQSDLSYLYCLCRQGSWEAAQTKTEMERRLFGFYTSRQITPSDSSWGSHYQLKPGEKMIQYMIFNKEPFDVVYDADSNVVETFTSYE